MVKSWCGTLRGLFPKYGVLLIPIIILAVAAVADTVDAQKTGCGQQFPCTTARQSQNPPQLTAGTQTRSVWFYGQTATSASFESGQLLLESTSAANHEVPGFGTIVGFKADCRWVNNVTVFADCENTGGNLFFLDDSQRNRTHLDYVVTQNGAASGGLRSSYFVMSSAPATPSLLTSITVSCRTDNIVSQTLRLLNSCSQGDRITSTEIRTTTVTVVHFEFETRDVTGNYDSSDWLFDYRGGATGVFTSAKRSFRGGYVVSASIGAQPTPPPSLTVDSTTSTTQTVVQWTGSTFNTPTGYTVLICPGSTGTTCTTFQTTNASTRSLNIPNSGNLTPGLTYRIAVVAFNINGNSNRRYSASFEATGPPSAPNNFECLVNNGYDRGTSSGSLLARSDGQVTCSWGAPTTGSVTGYTFTSTVPAPTGVTRSLASTARNTRVDVPYDPTRDVQSFTMTLKATNTFGDSPTVNETGSVYPIPPQVQSFEATPDSTSIALEWGETRSTNNANEIWQVQWGAVGVNQTCGASSAAVPLSRRANISNISTREYNVAGLQPVTQYCVAIARTGNALVLKRRGIRAYAAVTTLNANTGAPNVPTNLSIGVGALNAQASQYSVTFGWSAPSGAISANGYRVQRLADGVNEGSEINVPSGTTTAVNVDVGERTGFKVRSYACGDGDAQCANPKFSNFETLDGTYLMEAPSLMLTAESMRVTMSWSGSSELLSAVTGWLPEYKLSTDSLYTPVAEQTDSARTFTVDSLTAERTYNFRIRATNASHTSPYGEDNADTIAATVDGPNVPESVTAVGQYNDRLKQTELRLDWAAPTSGNSVDGYVVEMRLGCAGTTMAVLLGNQLTYSFYNVAVDTRICANVSAYRDVGGENRSSGTVSFERFVPGQPTGLSLSEIVGGFIIEWGGSFNQNIASFTLRRSHRGTDSDITDIVSSARTYRVENLVVGDTYAFQIRAVAPSPGNGAGQFSTLASGVVIDAQADAPGAPQNVTLRIVADANDQLKANAQFSWAAGALPAAEGFETSYKAAGDANWIPINNNVGPAETALTVAELATGISYVFRIRAFRTVNSQLRYSEYVLASGSVAGVRANPTDCSVTALPVPAGVNVPPRTGITLNWTPPAEATPGSEIPSAMVVEYRTGSEVAYRQIKLDGTTGQYEVPQVLAGQRYDFRLFAEFEFGLAFSEILVTSIIADLSSGNIACTTPEEAELLSLTRSPEIFDVHLSRSTGDRDEVVLRWTDDETARYYELRERLGYQDSRLLVTDGISRADPISGVNGPRKGYAAGGHIISHGLYQCLSGCWIGVEEPKETSDGPSYEIRFEGSGYYVLAIYLDETNDSFYLVMQGDVFDQLSDVSTDWLEWDVLTVDERANFETDEISQVFLEFKTDLDPTIAAEIYSEAVPQGAYTFGSPANAMRTVVRWEGGGQTSEYGVIDPVLRRPRLTTFKGAGIVARGTEQLVYVVHGTGSWFSVRSVLPDNERSAWSAPRYYDAGMSALPPVPYPDAIVGETPDGVLVEPDAQDFGVRSFLRAMGIGEGAFGLDGVAIAIAIVVSFLLGAAGYIFTPENNPQARVALMAFLTLSTWMVLAPTVGQLHFAYVATPLLLVVISGLIAIYRRAG